MANTISFNTDMTAIEIKDANQSVIFSGSLSGFGAIIYLDSNGELTGITALQNLVGTPVSKTLNGWTWSVSYDAVTKTLSFIGDDDVDTGIDQEDFGIDQRNGVQVKVSGTNLVLTGGLV